MLDAVSSLTVANDFGNKSRDVYLDGEAIFDVTHNEKLPFIVHTSFYSVRVLGTLFNVKAYRNEKSSETALLRGRVEIVLNDNKRIALRPNNKIVFSVDGESEMIAGNDVQGSDNPLVQIARHYEGKPRSNRGADDYPGGE